MCGDGVGVDADDAGIGCGDGVGGDCADGVDVRFGVGVVEGSSDLLEMMFLPIA